MKRASHGLKARVTGILIVLVSASSFALADPAEFIVGPFQSDVQNAIAEFRTPAKDSSCVVEIDPSGKEIADVPSQIGRDVTPWKSEEASVAWLVPGETKVGQTRRFQLRDSGSKPSTQPSEVKLTDDGTLINVENSFYRLSLNRARGGGISSVTHLATNDTWTIQMCDEFYSGNKRAMIWNDPAPQVRIVEKGPLRATVVVETQIKGTEFKPIRAVYAYTFWATLPVVRLSIWIPAQETDTTWRAGSVAMIGATPATHPDSLSAIVSGDPIVTNPLPAADAKQLQITLTGLGQWRQWGAVTDTKGNAVGLIGPELSGIWGTARSVAVNGPSAAWNGEERRWTGYVYIGPAGEKGSRIADTAKLVQTLRAEARIPEFESAAASQGPRATIAKSLHDLAVDYARGGFSEDRARRILRLAEAVAKDASSQSPFLVDTADGLVIGNDDVVLAWASNADSSLDLVGMMNARSGHEFRQAADQSTAIFSTLMGSADGKTMRTVAVDRAKKFTHATKREADGNVELTLRWEACPIVGSAGTIDATATIRVARGDPLSRWRLRLDPHDDALGIWSVEFPILGSLGPRRGSNDREFVAAALKQGTLHPNPSAGLRVGDQYPSQYFMQFMTYWCDPVAATNRSNLYLATYDGSGNLKGFCARPDTEPGTFAMLTRHQPTWMGVAKKPFEMDYDAIVGSFPGDWYDACQTYRAWATKQVWCSRGTIDKRTDTPQWFKNSVVTFRPDGAPDAIVPKMLHLREAFGSDLPAFANWYGGLWDTKNAFANLPFLLPAVNGAKSAVETLAKNDLRTVAYSCVDLWSDERADYQTLALPNAVKNADGTPLIAEWKPGHQAVMCPATKVYQKALVDAVVEAEKQTHIKGVYLDLLGCGPLPCFATDHGHPVGAGQTWVQGYRQLCAEMRKQTQAIDPEFVMFGESSAECFIDVRDGCVLFHGITASLAPLNLPMFQVVYGDYTMQHGPKSGGWSNEPIDAWFSVAGFMYGALVGRIFDDSLVGSPLHQHWVTLARYRKACLPYFVGGRVLRPLEIRYLSEPKTDLQRAGYAVLSMVRRSSQDSSVALMFGNTTLATSPIEFEYTIDPAQLGFDASKPLKISRRSPAGDEMIETITGVQTRKLTLSPTQVDVLIVAAQ